MRKYIDAQVLIENIHRCLWTNDKPHVEWFIDSLPAADVQKVKHGRWITKGQDIFCSVCGEESAYTFCGASKFSNYCPNCGSKMDKGIMSTHYTIFINDSLVGYIEADSQEEAVEYAKENWKIEAINMDEGCEDESR